MLRVSVVVLSLILSQSLWAISQSELLLVKNYFEAIKTQVRKENAGPMDYKLFSNLSHEEIRALTKNDQCETEDAQGSGTVVLNMFLNRLSYFLESEESEETYLRVNVPYVERFLIPKLLGSEHNNPDFILCFNVGGSLMVVKAFSFSTKTGFVVSYQSDEALGF